MKAKTIFGMMIACLMVGAVCSCTGMKDAAMKINTPAVQTQVLGDAEKVLLAGGGALLISGGNGGAAVAAMTAQEVQNIPGLQKALAAGTPAVVSVPAAESVPGNALLPVVADGTGKSAVGVSVTP